MLSFDPDFVRHWSDRYVAEMPRLEQTLLDDIGPASAVRGHMTPDDLEQVGRWKAARATGYLARNEPALVEDVTRVAFATDTPDRLRHRILCLLAGVGHPMASAILTVWRPAENTVLDYRAVEALQELAKRGVLDSDAPKGRRSALPDYWTYLQLYLPIAERLGVSCRDLDRALWKWNNAGMPGKAAES